MGVTKKVAGKVTDKVKEKVQEKVDNLYSGKRASEDPDLAGLKLRQSYGSGVGSKRAK